MSFQVNDDNDTLDGRLICRYVAFVRLQEAVLFKVSCKTTIFVF